MSQLKRFMPSFGIAVLILYFSYHALSGEQSALKWSGLRNAEIVTNAELTALIKAKNDLEKQNSLLRNASLDLDYLDERVRTKLNYIMPEDMIVVTK
ncbi:MAG: septum formation initiator family protein [Robiginitomaculum sp.]|nr:septum formation initiator family protein [Robiginitomaculum sp.]